MIIDLILDRQDDENDIAAGYTHKRLFNGELVPLAYSPSEFYRRVREYETGFDFAPEITLAMDYGTESDVKIAICNYIIANDYNPEICNFVNSVNWIS